MELGDYNITFVHIKGKNNVLADAISRLKMLDIYKERMENEKIPVVINMQEHVTEVHEASMHTLSTTRIHTEEKSDITCKKLALQLHHSNKGNFKLVIMSANGIYTKTSCDTFMV